MTFAPGINEEKVMEVALESGADDVIVNDDKSIEVTTAAESFLTVKDAMVAANCEPVDAEITMIAANNIDIQDKETAEKIIRLIDMLEDLEDVQEVYSNADISEEALASID